MFPAMPNRNQSRFGRQPFWRSLLLCKHARQPWPGPGLWPFPARDPAHGLTRQESGTTGGWEEAQGSQEENKESTLVGKPRPQLPNVSWGESTTLKRNRKKRRCWEGYEGTPRRCFCKVASAKRWRTKHKNSSKNKNQELVMKASQPNLGTAAGPVQ